MGAYNLKSNAYPTFHEQAEKIGTDINWLFGDLNSNGCLVKKT